MASHLIGRKELAKWGVDSGHFGFPAGRQTFTNLECKLVGRCHPAQIELIDAHLFNAVGVGQVAGQRGLV